MNVLTSPNFCDAPEASRDISDLQQSAMQCDGQSANDLWQLPLCNGEQFQEMLMNNRRVIVVGLMHFDDIYGSRLALQGAAGVQQLSIPGGDGMGVQQSPIPGGDGIGAQQSPIPGGDGIDAQQVETPGNSYFFGNLFSSITNFVGNLFSFIANFVGNLFSSIANFVRNLFSSIANFVRNLFSSIANFVGNLFSFIANFVRNLFSSITNFVGNLFASIFGFRPSANRQRAHVHQHLMANGLQEWNCTITKVLMFVFSMWKIFVILDIFFTRSAGRITQGLLMISLLFDAIKFIANGSFGDLQSYFSGDGTASMENIWKSLWGNKLLMFFASNWKVFALLATWHGGGALVMDIMIVSLIFDVLGVVLSNNQGENN